MGDVLAALAAQRWVPVLESGSAADAAATALACRDAGVTVVELSYATPGVLDTVRALADHGLIVGVGAVRSASEVVQAARVGAAYVASHFRPAGFVDVARASGVVGIVAGLTPHELAACVEDGADAITVFPARLFPPVYLAELRAVIGPTTPIRVAGGITAEPDEVKRWLAGGAAVVGVGSPLGTVGVDGAINVRTRARALCEAMLR